MSRKGNSAHAKRFQWLRIGTPSAPVAALRKILDLSTTQPEESGANPNLVYDRVFPCFDRSQIAATIFLPCQLENFDLHAQIWAAWQIT
jgi:hypothetical protein